VRGVRVFGKVAGRAGAVWRVEHKRGEV
jgi:hypothetical protein